MIINIEKIVYNGYGLARKDGKTYFVPYVLPEEEVIIKEYQQKKDYIIAYPENIIKPSPNRIEPLCKYFTNCGGCDFLHTTYEYQLSLKKDILIDQLKRIGKIETEIEKIIPSLNPFNYRNRVQLKFDGKHLGFYKRDSHEVVDIDSCLITKEDINKIIYPLKKFLFKYAISPNQIQIFSNKKDEKLLKLTFSDSSQIANIIHDLTLYKEEIDEKIKGIGFYIKEDRVILLGEDIIFENVKDYKFRISMDSFFQINIFQVENLIDEVVNEFKDNSYKKVVDFYCGVGTLTIPVSKYVKNALGIESNPEAVQDAKANIKHNKLSNVKFLKAKTEKGLKYTKDFMPDVVIFDPPRSGLNKNIINEISEIKSIEKIIYVSCEPSTLARDLKDFINKGFKLKHVKLLDMFSQTYHIESIVVLKREI